MTGPGRHSPAQTRFRLALDPIQAAAVCVVAATGAAAFATALSPHGYRQGSRLEGALLLGLLVSLFLLFTLKVLLGRRFAIGRAGATYGAMAGALILLLAAAGARTLAPTSSDGTHGSAPTAAQQAFQRWTLQAVPLLVRYKDTLAADASPSGAGPASGRVDLALLARVKQARRRLLALEPPIRRLVRSAPADLRPFMPLLTRAVVLAAAAQGRYQAALAAHGRRSRALRRQANSLLRRSQQAMAAFSIDVNGVGGRLANG